MTITREPNDIEISFEQDGFVVVDHIFNQSEVKRIAEQCESKVLTSVGTRNLLKFDWVKALASRLIDHQHLSALMPKNAVAVQCNYFSKDIENNWSVGLHRDLSIPVESKVNSRKWSGWSIKEGALYAQPPKHVLSQMVAVRLHLEDNTRENGALEIVPGSHKGAASNPKRSSIENSVQQDKRQLCMVKQGGVLAMRPLALHSSTKLKLGKRRVLHFVFGPEHLPDNAKWPAYKNS